MVLVRIKDHVQYAYTYEEGTLIYELIAPAFSRGEVVAVSFDGIKAVPSSFINASLLQLTASFSLDDIRSRLQIVDSTHFINDMIKRGFQTAGQKSANTIKNIA